MIKFEHSPHHAALYLERVLRSRALSSALLSPVRATEARCQFRSHCYCAHWKKGGALGTADRWRRDKPSSAAAHNHHRNLSHVSLSLKNCPVCQTIGFMQGVARATGDIAIVVMNACSGGDPELPAAQQRRRHRIIRRLNFLLRVIDYRSTRLSRIINVQSW